MAEKRIRRRLAAIVSADVVGWSLLMGEDEAGTLATFKRHREELIDPKVEEYGGRIVSTAGDSLLVEYPSAVDAIRCSVEIQEAMAERNADLPEDMKMLLRVGINLGEVIIDSDDVFGDGVNIAARLQALAEPGGVCVSGKVHDEVGKKLDIAFDDLGDRRVKNIDRPVRVYRVVLEGAPVSRDGAPTTAPPQAAPDKPSIAVLPFDSISADPGQEYLSDGIVEAITAALSRIRSFLVIARNSAFTYKGRATNVQQVGQELGVAYLLEGSVQHAGERLRITAQLVETSGGTHVWAERYDGSTADIFDLQDRITEQVAGALQPSIRLAEIERVRRKRPQDLGAYDFAMQAMPHVWVLEKEESARALELLQKALDIDPSYPLALSLAAWCHAQRSVYDWAEDIRKSQATALQLAERAAELSGEDPLILAVLGTVHTFVRNHGTARVLLERAVALDPNAAWAYSRLGWLETYADRPKQGIAHFEHALRLSPLDPMNFNNYVGIAAAHEVAGEYGQAVTFYERALEERPHAEWIYRNLVSSLVGAGRMEEAAKTFERLMEVYPDLTASKVKQALVFSNEFLGRMARNLKMLGLPD